MPTITPQNLSRQNHLHISFYLLMILVLAAASPALAFENKPKPSLYPQDMAIDAPGVEVDTKFAFIKSWIDLDNYLNGNHNKSSPLFALSSDGLNEFLDSLVFTELGLASFNAKPLARELTVSQIYELMGLFGLQRTVAALAADARSETELDRQILSLPDLSVEKSSEKCPLLNNRACTPPATCRTEVDAICITCNCGMIP